MKKRITLGLIDDQHLVRTGFRTILESWKEMEVIFESEDGHSVINQLKEIERRPLLLLLDLHLPNLGDRIYSGAHLTVDLKQEFPEIKVLILSVQDDHVTIADLIEKGAHGFLSKNCSPKELHKAILSIVENGSYINEKTLQSLQERLNQGKPTPSSKSDELSGREIDVLQLICQQMTAEEIGEKLFISPKTVNGHRNNLLQKTGSKNITGLVMYAVKKGIVEIA